MKTAIPSDGHWQRLTQLLHEADRTLAALYKAHQEGMRTIPDFSLIFAEYPRRKTTHYRIRISEQEARQVIAHLAAKHGFFYSVETPTRNKFSFSKNAIGERSGRVDLTLYDQPPSGPLFNFELKSSFKDEESEHAGHIRKDMLKFIGEGCCGVFLDVARRGKRQQRKGMEPQGAIEKQLANAIETINTKENYSAIRSKEITMTLVLHVCDLVGDSNMRKAFITNADGTVRNKWLTPWEKLP